MNRQFRRFLFEVPWTHLIVGATLGAIGALGAEKWLIGRIKLDGWFEIAVGLLLGGLVGWVIPEFVNSARTSWRTAQPLRALLNPFHNDSSPVTFFLAAMYPAASNVFEKSIPLEINKTDIVVPHHGIPWVLTESDTQAFGYVMALLAQAGKISNISIVRDDSGINIAETNIIVIGSPKSNFKSRQINNSFKKLPVRFDTINGRQIIIDENRKHQWQSDDAFDYGILAKLPNEQDIEKAVIILAGISYIGTAGVGYFLWKRWRDVEVSTSGKYFAMVIN
ncbi:MAG: hypothetical protein KKC76_15980 [Proteobacteria bacterium]|nr:hypothetical protein [Pseudomonadota bacterium]MBU4294609.1 hypothetical protein [Pseudomonadota bacterium]MCG2747144.1 hypothetical protein [Desulfobulbaceae bacterium]